MPRCPGRCRRSAVARRDIGPMWRRLSVGQRASDQPAIPHDRTQVGQRPSDRRTADAVDGRQVRRLQRSHVVEHCIWVGDSAGSSHAGLDHGHAGVIEAVEVVQSGSGAMRCHSHSVGTERDDHQPLVPCRRCPAHHEHARQRLGEPPGTQRSGDATSAEVQRGSLLAGECSMLSGCKLGNGAHRVVGHAATVRRGCQSPGERAAATSAQRSVAVTGPRTLARTTPSASATTRVGTASMW